jgi:hypothetical protein
VSQGGVSGVASYLLPSAVLERENPAPLSVSRIFPEGSDADRLSQRQGGPIYESLPVSAPDYRLVREAVSGYYLRKIKFPDLDKPFVELDPATMP